MEHDADFLKESVRVLSQALMEMEVEEHVGAARHERSPERVGQRNGYRERSWDTRVGTVELKVPRVRDGGYFPSLLELRRRAERALAAVVQEAYVHGVSTRKVDELVKALGMGGISKCRVSELCEELDEEVERFRNRSLEDSYPCVWVDATYLKARQDGRVTSTALVIAVGVKGDSAEREVLGLDVGPSEDGAFWTSFLRSLVARRLLGGEAGHQRLPPRLKERCGGCLGGRIVAEVPGTHHPNAIRIRAVPRTPSSSAADRPRG
jgi:putative transposase